MVARGGSDYYADGDWNATCYECGRKRKASTMVKNWQGYYLCPKHNEPRQPQDFARGVPDNQTPPWVQPMPANTFSQTEFLETEASDNDLSYNIYIMTETSYPLETEN